MSLHFDCEGLEPREIRGISYKGKEYVLREASEGAKVLWRDAQFKHHRMVDGKLTADSMEGITATEPLLISLCLFEVYERKGEPSERPVDIQVVRGFSSRFAERLYQKALEISELNHTDSPERKALLTALQGSDSPIQVADFRNWVSVLKDKDAKTYDPLWNLVKPSDEEDLAKNGQVASATTSD